MSQSTNEGPDSTRFDRLQPAEMVLVNRLCDEFESAWQNKKSASLETFLAPLAESTRNAALPELVLIDLLYRQRFGLSESADWYLQKFPTLDKQWLEHQFAMQQKTELSRANESESANMPSQFGDYLIRGDLGSGGMGHVYRAEHKLMGRVVAIKVLKENRLTDSASRQRFEREVRTLARLSHPNIVTAFDAREDQGTLYLVTELVEGEDLFQRVKRKGPLSPLEAMHYIWQAAKGLQYAHEQGIVHRDIKPSNLILNRKKVVKVLDLGLARLQAPNSKAAKSPINDPTLTHTGNIVGTAAFMAPEQARSALGADERSDIYSLGCTLYFLLTGQPPFRGETDFETVLAHIEQPIPSLNSEPGGKRIASGVTGLINRMLAKSPGDRPQSMRAIVDGLGHLIKQEQRTAADTFMLTKIEPDPWYQRALSRFMQFDDANVSTVHRIWLILGVALCFVLIAGLLTQTLWRSGTNPSVQLKNDGSGEQESVIEPSPEATNDSAPLIDSLVNQTEASATIRFDGQDDYLSVDKFDLELPETIRMEMAVIVDDAKGPANLVSWSGPQLFVLYMADFHWGVAYFDGQRSRLVRGPRNVRPGRLQLVAGEWDGKQLKLYVDGQPMEVEEVEYPLFSNRIGLFIGGVPDGHLPAEQGTRYFHGNIATVRIQQDTESRPARTLAELRKPSESTIALFPFDEGSGQTSHDQSKHAWEASLNGPRWSR